MYVATKKKKKKQKTLHPHISSYLQTHGMDDSLAVGVLSIQRSGTLSVLLGDQGDGRRSSSYSACTASTLARVPETQGSGKQRTSQKGGTPVSIPGESSVYSSVLCSCMVNGCRVPECRFMWAGQDWRKHRIGIPQEEGWPKPSCPSSVWCTLALLAVCLRSLCITVSPVEIGTRGS